MPYKDQNDNAVVYPRYLLQAEKRLKREQRRLSRKYRKGAKPQSNNYHKQRKRLGKVHLKVQRQRKDWAIKLARCVVASNDVVVYEDLQIANMVKNHTLAKSIADALRITVLVIVGYKQNGSDTCRHPLGIFRVAGCSPVCGSALPT